MNDGNQNAQPASVGVWLGVIIGAWLGGPGGAAVGGMVGATVESLTGNILGNLASSGITNLAQRARSRFSPQQLQISRNLQTTFRAAFQHAVYDIAGEDAFSRQYMPHIPQQWRRSFSTSSATLYRSTQG